MKTKLSTQPKTKLRETEKALESVSKNDIRSALKSQFFLAERALQKRNKLATAEYLEILAATVLVLRKTLMATTVSSLLRGIIIDAENNEIVLARIIERSGSYCSRGESCLTRAGHFCVAMGGVGGCGTITKILQK